MDVVLEVFDSFILDRAYSALLPASNSPGFPGTKYNASSATFSNYDPSTLTATQRWIYKPSSSYLQHVANYIYPSEYAYGSQWPRDNIYRQAISLFLITWIFGLFIYFVCASLSYVFIFDKTAVNHPKYLKNQIRMEIRQASEAMPIMSILTVPFFLAEVRGYSKIYDSLADAPFAGYSWLQFPIFLLFTDFFIYWIHRGLHHPLVYKRLHKPHHKWIMPTPYASHAFHPLDGFAQSIPYHVFPFILPLQKFAYVGLFMFINVWTIFIHDGEYVANSPIINGAACHTLHHLHFRVNYGQYTTLWDRIGGSYREPNEELFQRETKYGQKLWNRQAEEMEEIVKEVEGEDDREYRNEEKKVQ